jgi:hypothetical protein
LFGLPLALCKVGVVLPVVRDLEEPLKVFPLFFSTRNWTFFWFFQPLDICFQVFDLGSLDKSFDQCVNQAT